jgi:hypothetical protein
MIYPLVIGAEMEPSTDSRFSDPPGGAIGASDVPASTSTS